VAGRLRVGLLGGRAVQLLTQRSQLPAVAGAEDGEQALQELERLRQAISARWRSDKSTVELLTEMRR
jgi:hypothetical protein